MKTLPVIAALLLAGCGSGGRDAPPELAEGPVQQECRAEARQSPAVQQEWRRVVIGLPSSEEQVRQAQRQAELRAYSDCLRRRGQQRGGGVEPLRRPGF
jgi:uncharacterized lipoprotein YmbA